MKGKGFGILNRFVDLTLDTAFPLDIGQHFFLQVDFNKPITLSSQPFPQAESENEILGGFHFHALIIASSSDTLGPFSTTLRIF
jgi:hypothetical protein